MRHEIAEIIKNHPLEAISLLGSVCAAIISFIVYVAVWQTNITHEVSANTGNIQSQQLLLQKINETLNTINTRGQVTNQQVNDINDKVNLIYQALQPR